MIRLPSPSMFVSITALVIALGGAGYSATGGNFILGQVNSADDRTILASPINDRALQVTNNDTGNGATALGLSVAAGRPPLRRQFHDARGEPQCRPA